MKKLLYVVKISGKVKLGKEFLGSFSESLLFNSE